MILRLPKIRWNSFAMGAATSLVGGSLLHPVLVSIAKAGMGAVSMAQDAWSQASAEVGRVRAEAAQAKHSSAGAEALLNELRAVRSDIADVKAKVGIS
jgi:hypothetical protein